MKRPSISIRCLLVVICLITGACGDAPSGDAGAADAQALLAAGKLAEAERQVKAELREAPDDPALRLLLGRIYLAQGDGAAAASTFERARDGGAGGTALTAGLADSLMLQKRYAAALELLDSVQPADLTSGLLRRRLTARLRVPLASPGGLFGDARQLLARESDATALEQLAGEPGVIAANAGHVRRALAYWSCPRADHAADSGSHADAHALTGLDGHAGGQAHILADSSGAIVTHARSGSGAAIDAGSLMQPPAWANLEEAGRRVLEVGPEEELKTPSAAARVARDGDIVEIAAGVYSGDVATWNASGLWLRAAGGQVVLDSGGAVAEDMGIWVIRGDDTIVEGIRFVGARATHDNGSGIRLLARNLWVRRSEFHDNENGILSFNRPGGEIVIERSIFTENGAGDGYSHNVYIGGTDRLVFRFNYSAGARIGHELKSRALENYILYNRLTDGTDGNSSYTIDLPEGGFALVLGNVIQQGPGTVNKHMVTMGQEDAAGREHRFIFAYNTFYNRSLPATFIRDATGAGVALVNNVFAGAPAAIDAVSSLRAGNAFSATGGLADPGAGDFDLVATASFIDKGEPLEDVGGISVVPRFEYLHPADGRPRAPVWRPDPGAHEFCGWPDYPTVR